MLRPAFSRSRTVAVTPLCPVPGGPFRGEAGGRGARRALSRIRLRHLACFVAVAQERTLARAAARLHLSQPAVSKTIAELEELAGRRLVERGRAGTQLTPAGEEFLRYAADVTQALESAAAALTGAAAPVTPTLRVAALPTVAGGLLAQALARLRERRPHAGVSVWLGGNPELLAALKAGEIDVAVGRMAEPAMMQGIAFELLYAESLAVVTRPEHPLAAPGTSRWPRPRCSPTRWSSRGRHRAAARRRRLLRRPRAHAAAGPHRDPVRRRRPGAGPGLRRGVDHPAPPGPARPRPAAGCARSASPSRARPSRSASCPAAASPRRAGGPADGRAARAGLGALLTFTT